MADALPNHFVVYFHNLAYDACLFSKFNITNSIDKGTRTMSKSFNHNGKHRPLNFALFDLSLTKRYKQINKKNKEK